MNVNPCTFRVIVGFLCGILVGMLIQVVVDPTNSVHSPVMIIVLAVVVLAVVIMGAGLTRNRA